MGSLWNYLSKEIDSVDDNASDGKSFKSKTEIVGKTPERLLHTGNPWDVNQQAKLAVPVLNVKVAIPFKYLSNFWRCLDLPVISCLLGKRRLNTIEVLICKCLINSYIVMTNLFQ